MNRRAIGNQGEDAACAYLKKQGWKVLDRNVVRRGGEIDIIAEKKGVYAFIEVKTRSSNRYGTPAEAVDARKQRRIALVAMQYAAEKKLLDARLRFDVIEVTPEGVRHIEGAFNPPEM